MISLEIIIIITIISYYLRDRLTPSCVCPSELAQDTERRNFELSIETICSKDTIRDSRIISFYNDEILNAFTNLSNFCFVFCRCQNCSFIVSDGLSKVPVGCNSI